MAWHESMETQIIRVLLLSEQRMLLDAVGDCLHRDPGFDVTTATFGGETVFWSETSAAWNVVVIDTDLASGEAFEVASRIHRSKKFARLFFLASNISEGNIEWAMRLNATGFILKTESYEMLKDSVKRVANGEEIFSAQIQQQMIHHSSKAKRKYRFDSPLSLLTNRQLEILQHLAEGNSVKEVARKLHLSPKSVETHKYHIMKRLDIHDRVHLARFAIRQGLVEP